MDTLIAENPRAVPGDNNPPAPTPFELSAAEVEGIYLEVGNWTGKAVTSETEEAAIARLMEMLRAANKTCEARKKEELDELQKQVKEIQDRWNLLIGNNKSVTGKIIRALEVCKAALRPWLEEKDRIQREAAERARQEAEEKRRAAEEAQRAASLYDLEQKEAAEAAAREAAEAEKIAKRAEKARPQAHGASKAIGIRKVYTAEVTDHRLLLNWIAANHASNLKDWLDAEAKRLVAQGFREIPGVKVHEGSAV